MDRAQLHLFLSSGRHESRFLRLASAVLTEGVVQRVVLAAKHCEGAPVDEEPVEGIIIRRVRLPRIPGNRSLLAHAIKEFAWRRAVIKICVEFSPSCLVSHSIRSLQAGVALKRRINVPLMYDAHELETERNGLSGWRKRLDRCIERQAIRKCDAVSCVSQSIADWYAKEYQIAAPLVVRNIPSAARKCRQVERVDIRTRFWVPDNSFLYIYQGGFFDGRRIPQLIRVFRLLGAKYHILFMGYGKLEHEIRRASAEACNIHWLPAVPPSQILAVTGAADVGIVGVENVCLSYYYSLPNKLYEYIASGIPCIGPKYPEIAKALEQLEGGWVVGESDQAWSECIRSISRQNLDDAKRRVRNTQLPSSSSDYRRWALLQRQLLARCN